jgi:hypothetical protein
MNPLLKLAWSVVIAACAVAGFFYYLISYLGGD